MRAGRPSRQDRTECQGRYGVQQKGDIGVRRAGRRTARRLTYCRVPIQPRTPPLTVLRLRPIDAHASVEDRFAGTGRGHRLRVVPLARRHAVHLLRGLGCAPAEPSPPAPGSSSWSTWSTLRWEYGHSSSGCSSGQRSACSSRAFALRSWVISALMLARRSRAGGRQAASSAPASISLISSSDSPACWPRRKEGKTTDRGSVVHAAAADACRGDQ